MVKWRSAPKPDLEPSEIYFVGPSSKALARDKPTCSCKFCNGLEHGKMRMAERRFELLSIRHLHTEEMLTIQHISQLEVEAQARGRKIVTIQENRSPLCSAPLPEFQGESEYDIMFPALTQAYALVDEWVLVNRKAEEENSLSEDWVEIARPPAASYKDVLLKGSSVPVVCRKRISGVWNNRPKLQAAPVISNPELEHVQSGAWTSDRTIGAWTKSRSASKTKKRLQKTERRSTQADRDRQINLSSAMHKGLFIMAVVDAWQLNRSMFVGANNLQQMAYAHREAPFEFTYALFGLFAEGEHLSVVTKARAVAVMWNDGYRTTVKELLHKIERAEGKAEVLAVLREANEIVRRGVEATRRASRVQKKVEKATHHPRSKRKQKLLETACCGEELAVSANARKSLLHLEKWWAQSAEAV